MTVARQNALMRVAYGGQEPEDWVTYDEDGNANWDKWALMWTSLEFKMGMDNAKRVQVGM